MLNFLLPYEVWSEGPLGVAAHLSRPEIRQRFRAGLDALAVPLEEITIAWTAENRPTPRGETSRPMVGALHGMTVADFVAERGKPVEEALIDLLIDSNLATLMVVGPFEKDHLVEPLIQHDLAILGSDGIYFPGGHVHPRVYGSAGRWLGPLVRDRRVHTLEQAVHKASGKSAERFGLASRGIVREGALADVIVFDPQTVADRATYADPRQESIGFAHVIVNGCPINEQPWPGGQLPGRWLKYS
jgi:N-acyl-D-amino-acid deacylase